MKCKKCETLNLTHGLRFFIINEHTEIFKCESTHCLFPFRSFIFRDRTNQSYYTLKPSATTSGLVQSPRPTCGSPDTSVFETLLNDLFPGDPSPETPTPPLGDLEPVPPLPVASPVKIPEYKLTRTLNFVSKPPRKSVESKPKIQPKLIKKPLDLVKELLVRRTVDAPVVGKALEDAERRVKKLEPVLQSIVTSPKKPIEKKTRPSILKGSPKTPKKQVPADKPQVLAPTVSSTTPPQSPVNDRPKRNRKPVIKYRQ